MEDKRQGLYIREKISNFAPGLWRRINLYLYYATKNQINLNYELLRNRFHFDSRFV